MTWLFRAIRLHYDRGSKPSDRGQWFCALMGHRPVLSVVRIPAPRPESNLPLLCPRSPGFAPRSLADYLIVDPLIIFQFLVSGFWLAEYGGSAFTTRNRKTRNQKLPARGRLSFRQKQLFQFADERRRQFIETGESLRCRRAIDRIDFKISFLSFGHKITVAQRANKCLLQQL
jgi:hypothetical protein